MGEPGVVLSLGVWLGAVFPLHAARVMTHCLPFFSIHALLGEGDNTTLL
nr:MAG TPA: hypothetical protein [Bacteriophage sp.]